MRFDKSDRPEQPPGPTPVLAAKYDGVKMRHPVHGLTADVDPDPANVANAEAQGWMRVE